MAQLASYFWRLSLGDLCGLKKTIYARESSRPAGLETRGEGMERGNSIETTPKQLVAQRAGGIYAHISLWTNTFFNYHVQRTVCMFAWKICANSCINVALGMTAFQNWNEFVFVLSPSVRVIGMAYRVFGVTVAPTQYFPPPFFPSPPYAGFLFHYLTRRGFPWFKVM